MELTGIYAGKVAEALTGAVDTRKLAEAWAALHPGEFAAAKALDPVLSQFLARAATALQGALRKVLPDAHAEGWALGQQSAVASARAASVRKAAASADLPAVNWGEWTPGDPEAARQVAGSGLRDLLASQEVTIKSIASTRLDELGDVLAAYVGSPESVRPLLPAPVPPMYSVDALASKLRGVLDNPGRAQVVAHTEIARASQAAASWVFRGLGVHLVRVSTAGDKRVCPRCQAAEDAGAEPVGTYDVPLHPLCRCATVAAQPPLQPLPKLPGVPDSAMEAADAEEAAAAAEEEAAGEAPEAVPPWNEAEFKAAEERAHEVQDSLPVQWHYQERRLTPASRGLVGDPAALDEALTRYVFGKAPTGGTTTEPALNAALRGSQPMTPQMRADEALIDEALQASRTPAPVAVFRGWQRAPFMPAGWQDSDLTGLTWNDPAFTSSTASPDAAESYTGDEADGGFAARILLPEGFPALSIADEAGGLDDEGEIVLPHGLAFRVTADHGAMGEYGIRWLDVAVSLPGNTGGA